MGTAKRGLFRPLSRKSVAVRAGRIHKVSCALRRQGDDKFAAYSKTFITRISAVSCALRGLRFKE